MAEVARKHGHDSPAAEACYTADRLIVAHRDLSRIVGILRNPECVVAMIDASELDPSKPTYSLPGWIAHFSAEHERWHKAAKGRRLSHDPHLAECCASCCESIPRIVDAMIRAGRGQSREVDMQTRVALARVIEEELE